MSQTDYIHINNLVERVKNNDSDALWELFDFYQPVINLCIKRVHQRYETIEKNDLYSECVFVLKDLCMKFDESKSYFSYYFDSRLQPYLVAKIKSKYLEKINIIELKEDYLYDVDLATELENKVIIHAALEKLPESTKKVIDLIYFKNITQSECAKILQISQPALNKKLKAGLKLLKKLLENEL